MWERVRIVDDPMTEYQRYQVESQKEAQACGELVRVARRSAVGADLGPDFWLFDAGMPNEHAAVMHYDSEGRFLGAEVTTDVAAFKTVLERMRDHAVQLNVFLAELVGA